MADLSYLELITDQQPICSRPTTRGQSLLRLNLRFASAATAFLEFLRFPLFEPTNTALRVWWKYVSLHARR